LYFLYMKLFDFFFFVVILYICQLAYFFNIRQPYYYLHLVYYLTSTSLKKIISFALLRSPCFLYLVSFGL
jgi:hypothetical protein